MLVVLVLLASASRSQQN